MLRTGRSVAEVEDDRYRLLVDAITDYAIFMLDPEGRVASWNPGARRFKGYETDEILGRHFSCFYPPEESLAGAPDHALHVAVADSRYETEGWRVRKDGSRFWANVVIDPIRNASGELIGFANITRDLSERRAAEEALRQSEQQFTLLVQGVVDYALFMLDRQGRITSWNVGAERIKGYRPEEIIGEHFSRFYTDEDRNIGMPERGLETAAREGRFEREGWRVRKDGSRFWAHIVIDAIRDDAGQVIGFAKITRDVTERRETQLALEETQRALFQAQKLESIGRLTGGVAHDFNNLLTAVLGGLELLRKRLPADDPKALVLLDNAVHGAQRGATLTQRMLAFARRQELRTEPVDLPELVQGMGGLLERSIGPGVVIETLFPLHLPKVLTDLGQLETALLNMAVNARDAMPGGGHITISAHETEIGPGNPDNLKPGRYVRLAVADTGQGMDEQVLSRALEPFFTTKGVGKGTGLGLSMVHGLAMQSGGKLTLDSRPGEGTVVAIWLPVVPETMHAAPTSLRRTDLEAAPVDTPRRTVLVVDDDELVLTNTAAMLEDLGHTVIEASSGAQALTRLAIHREVELMVTDQAMPGMTGLQLADAVRALRPDLPIILATGFAELPADAGAGLRRLAKPFRQRELAEAIAASGTEG